MRVIIIGAVAAGTSAATEIRRNDKDCEIVMYEKDTYISYVGCGMPFYISDETEDFDALVPRSPKDFKDKQNIDIFTDHEVLSIDAEDKKIMVRDNATDQTFEDSYDKLIISTGATPVVPPIKGIDQRHVFVLRNINHMNEIKAYVEERKPLTAAVIGGGFIGMEMTESFRHLEMKVHLIVRSSLSKGIDPELTEIIEEHLKEHEVQVHTNASTTEITDEGVLLADGSLIRADIVLLATGIEPNTSLAAEAGVHLGQSGAIKTDEFMETNINDVYSCGDCIEVFNAVTGDRMYRPLGTTANKTGIIAGSNVSGKKTAFKGVLGTGIYRIFDLTAGQTGLSEEAALRKGYEVATGTSQRLNKSDFMGGMPITVKLIADKKDGTLLGAQVIGFEGADKRLDVLVTAITAGMKAEDLMYLDLAYAPPYSSARDPIYYAAVKLIAALK